MFPFTHIYCTKKISPNPTPSILYGSIFPDIPITGTIGWDTMTNETANFSKYLKENFSDLRGFADGLLLHEKPYGIDQFVHGDNGYAFTKGAFIINDVAKYFPQNPPNTAHNLIEFAVEILLAEKIPDFKSDIKPILIWSNENMNPLSQSFGTFFDINLPESIQTIKSYNQFLSGIDLSSHSKSIHFYTELSNKLHNTNYNDIITQELLTKAIDIIENNYEDFINKSISKCIKLQNI